MTVIEIIRAGISKSWVTSDQQAHNVVQALEDAGYRIVTDPPERPDWSEDKYGIELWFQNYKEWLERNGCPDAGRAD